jgi:lysozyme
MFDPPPLPNAKKKPKASWIGRALWLGLGLLIGIAGLWTALRFSNFELSEKVLLPFQLEGDHVFGIDVSHYQGKIQWDEVRTSHHPIQYVFIRSTMGHNGRDKQFKKNWKESKKKGYLRGAYHYYRPHENSEEQFKNFASKVELEDGDLPPILDMEEMSRYGVGNLREGINNWLRLAEDHYGVKPIIYTGRKFYSSHLEGHVDDYPLWIASYSGKHKLKGIDWTFHQFTERVKVKGIKGTVDGNDYNGPIEDLIMLCKGSTVAEEHTAP